MPSLRQSRRTLTKRRCNYAVTKFHCPPPVLRGSFCILSPYRPYKRVCGRETKPKRGAKLIEFAPAMPSPRHIHDKQLLYFLAISHDPPRAPGKQMAVNGELSASLKSGRDQNFA